MTTHIFFGFVFCRGGYANDSRPQHQRYRSAMKGSGGMARNSSVAESVRFQDDYSDDGTKSVMDSFQHRYIIILPRRIPFFLVCERKVCAFGLLHVFVSSVLYRCFVFVIFFGIQKGFSLGSFGVLFCLCVTWTWYLFFRTHLLFTGTVHFSRVRPGAGTCSRLAPATPARSWR